MRREAFALKPQPIGQLINFRGRKALAVAYVVVLERGKYLPRRHAVNIKRADVYSGCGAIDGSEPELPVWEVIDPLS